MTQLAKQRRLAIVSLFLAGAITGGIASKLFEPQSLRADPIALNGQKFEELQELVLAHEDLLKAISRDEKGLTINEPVKIGLLNIDPFPLEPTDPVLSVEGLVRIDPLPLEPTAPLLIVSGPSRFTGSAGDDPLMLITPEIHAGPLLAIDDGNGGQTLIDAAKIELLDAEKTATLSWEKIELLSPATKATLFSDRIELLHPNVDDPVLLGIDSNGGYLGAHEALFTGAVWAAEFIDTDGVIQPF